MQKLKGSYFAYLLLYLSFFFCMGIFGSILSVYLAGIGKTSKDIAIIMTANGIFTMVVQPFIGRIYDKVQKDRVVSLFLMALAAICGIAFSFLHSTLLLFLFNGLTMCFLYGVMPVCERMATRAPYRYGTMRIWGSVGYAAACQVAGWVYEAIDPSLNFWLLAVGALLTTLAFFLTDTHEQLPKAAKEENQEHVFRELFHNRPYRIFVVIIFYFQGAAIANSTYVPLLLKELIGSTSYVGTILSLGTMMELPIILLSHKYMDKLSGQTLVRICFTLLLIQFIVYSFSDAALLAGTTLFFCKSTATMLMIMVNLKVVLSLVKKEYSITALSVVTASQAMGMVVMNYVSGLMASAFGIHSVFMLLLGIAAIGFTLSFLLKVPEGNAMFGNKE